MTTTVDALNQRVLWKATESPRVPWEATVDGVAWRVRQNEFPEEVQYTLLVAEREVASFDDWPDAWTRALSTPSTWALTGRDDFPYETTVQGREWRVRLEDWPRSKYQYTLFVDGEEHESFLEWPSSWHLPDWKEPWNRPTANGGRRAISERYRDRAVTWRANDDAVYQMTADVDGQKWEIAIGDFPAQDLYHLIVEDVEVESFNEWPPAWRKPARV